MKQLAKEFLNSVFESNGTVNSEKLALQSESLQTLLTVYECAVKKLRTRIDIVEAEYKIKHHRSPIEFVESRIKKPVNIWEKLHRKGFDFSIESIVYNLNDVAGIRIICSFIDDIYNLADMLLKDTTFTLVEKVDYIKNPKNNGYRSLHLIVEVPIVFSDTVQKIKVELQIRTLAMDFWASLEHQIHYKKNLSKDEKIVAELKECADVIYKTDQRMQKIQRDILSNETELY